MKDQKYISLTLQDVFTALLHKDQNTSEIEVTWGTKRQWFPVASISEDCSILREGPEFRIPFKIRSVTVDLPIGVSAAPDYDQEYYNPSLINSSYYSVSVWNNHSVDFLRLERGIVFLDREAAAAYAKALLDE